MKDGRQRLQQVAVLPAHRAQVAVCSAQCARSAGNPFGTSVKHFARHMATIGSETIGSETIGSETIGVSWRASRQCGARRCGLTCHDHSEAWLGAGGTGSRLTHRSSPPTLPSCISYANPVTTGKSVTHTIVP